MGTAYSRLDTSSDYPMLQKFMLYAFTALGVLITYTCRIYSIQNISIALLCIIIFFILHPVAWRLAGVFRRFASPSGFRHKADYATAFHQKILWTFGPYAVATGLSVAIAGAPFYFWAKDAQGHAIYQQSNKANSSSDHGSDSTESQANADPNNTNMEDADPRDSQSNLKSVGDSYGSAGTQSVMAHDSSQGTDNVPAIASGIRTFRPSFECRGPLSSVEKIICDDEGLSQRDIDLKQIYNTLRSTMSGGALIDFKNQQRMWMIERSKCGDQNCLENMYNDRIEYLQNNFETSN